MFRTRLGWIRWAPMAIAAGAALGVLLGGGGRARMRREQLAGAVRHQFRRTLREGRHLAGQAIGAYERATRTPGVPVDDLTLLDRVESVLFKDPSMPKGRINLEVVGGVLFLRGELPDEREIERVVVAAADVPGVTGISNLLHTAGTPAPNKAAALRPRGQAHGMSR